METKSRKGERLLDKYKSKVLVLGADNTLDPLSDYQKRELLTGYSLSKHFSLSERRFQHDIEEYGELIVCAPLMKVLDTYRDLIGKPVNVNSFNRTQAKQDELRQKGFKAATVSPHVFSMAADVDTKDEYETLVFAKVMIQAGINTGIPIRVGYKQYLAEGMTFIHVDVCPLYYAPGRPRHSTPHPTQWETKLTW